jgi:hypothetical protein
MKAQANQVKRGNSAPEGQSPRKAGACILCVDLAGRISNRFVGDLKRIANLAT